MGASPSRTNDTKGPVQGYVRHTRQEIKDNSTRQEIKDTPNRQDIKVKPTRTSQSRSKSPLQRPSSSLSISSKASFSRYSILPPVTSRDEKIVERPTSGSTSGSNNMKTSSHTQGHDEGSVYLPDTRNPLPDIRNTSMLNSGSSDRMKTTDYWSSKHGRLTLQPLDSLRRMRKNDSRRHHRNRNEDFTQSGYNTGDLEKAIQASQAISEEQQSYGGEDNHSEHSFSEFEIQTSNISERSSLQSLDSFRQIRKNFPRKHRRNRNGDFTQSGYNQSDLQKAVQASLAISEEQQSYGGEDNHSEHSFSEFEIQTSNISERNEDLTESGYNNRDMDMARQMSLALSEELYYQQQEDEDMQEEEEDSGQRNEDLTESGYNNRDLDIARQMSLALSEELHYQQQDDEIMEKEKEEDEAEQEDSGESDTEEERRNIINEERDPSDLLLV
ncbi:hypothetical protein ACJMK2_023188 [Sinanodonta woodiana]|uniref:Uncharacterized protein n=1 Tax=Sinanodonta woodiana TaxID=1069815 RepID=A0ABD3T3F0_SINWO